MTTNAHSLQDDGQRALARLGGRVALAYLVATVAGLLTGVGHGPWWSAVPAALGVCLVALVVVPVIATCVPGGTPVACGVAVLAGAGALAVVCGAAPVVGWGHVHPIAGWTIPAIGLGLALGAGPLWGALGFAGMGVWFLLLTPPAQAGPATATLIGASVSVLVGCVLRVGAARGFATAEAEILAAEEARSARGLAERRLAARRRTDRVLHDTLLSTLTLLAHGGVGVDPAQVRASCQRDLVALRSGRWAVDDPGLVLPEARRPDGGLAPASPDPGQVASPDASARPDRLASSPPVTPDLAERIDSLRALAGHHGVTLRVHLQTTLAIGVFGGPTGTGEAAGRLFTPTALAAWSGAVAECVVNIARHAGVQAADLVIAGTERSVVTVVVDEGVGFDPDRVPSGRLGLAGSVRDRAREVGGRTRVWSRPGHGTVVELELPRAGTDHGGLAGGTGGSAGASGGSVGASGGSVGASGGSVGASGGSVGASGGPADGSGGPVGGDGPAGGVGR